MAFGLIVLGDEIMLGKRADKHFSKFVAMLGARGLRLAWCQYLGDERARIIETLRRSFAGPDVVFCCGGIGVTPDDHTRQAAAAALGVELALQPDAEREIRARFGADTTPQRLMLGHFPLGSTIIPNPYNRIPGFSVGDHHFLPGFPVMAWPMTEWVLDTRYAHLHHTMVQAERAIIVWEGNEGALLDLMASITQKYPRASVFSLPAFAEAGRRRQLELGVRGDPQQVEQAMEEMRAEVSRLGFEWEPAEGAPEKEKTRD